MQYLLLSFSKMLLNLYIISVLYFVRTEGRNTKDCLKSKWLNSFINYVSNDSKKLQVVLLTEDDAKNETPAVKNIVSGILQRIPLFSMTFKESINSSMTYRYPTLKNNPRASTIFILILFTKTGPLSSRLSDPIEYLIRLTNEKPRPKCLIMHLLKKRRFTYKKLLQDLWKKQFLDLTVVEILETSEKQSSKAILHNFNPFNKVYMSENFSSKSQWFPDKVKNLYGSEITSVTAESELMNPDLMLDAMSKAMNFTSNSVKVNAREFGTYHQKKENCTGKVRELIENKVQFMGNLAFSILSYPHLPYLKLSPVMLGTINAVVPRLVTSKVTIVSWKLFYTLLIAIILITALQFMPSNCKFERKFWRPIHMLQIILGISVEDPKKVKDRIIFGSVLLACMILSGYLFSILTDFELYVGSELEINTMEELNKSNLIPVFNPTVYSLTEKIEILHFQELRKKARLYSANFKVSKCLKNAAIHKNVSCVMLMFRAKVLIQDLEQTVKTIKVMEQPVLYGVYQWISEPGSAYSERFDQIIRRLVENGLMRRWGLYGPEKSKFNNIDLTGSGESGNLSYLLLNVILIGYLISLVGFFGELLISYTLKKRNIILFVRKYIKRRR